MSNNLTTNKMNRPYIIVHMMESVDGRIDCPMVAQISGEEYYDALDSLGKCSKLSGRVTAALECEALKEETAGASGAPAGKESVNVAVKADEYTIVADTHGRLNWAANEADGHPLLCILSEDVPEAHLQKLRDLGISWIAAGKGRIDLGRAMEMLRENFGVERVAVVGGGHICGGFLAAGLVDEVSVMIAPGIDGRKGEVAVFDGIVKDDGSPYRLHLNSVEQCPGTEVVWLRYSAVR